MKNKIFYIDSVNSCLTCSIAINNDGEYGCNDSMRWMRSFVYYIHPCDKLLIKTLWVKKKISRIRKENQKVSMGHKVDQNIILYSL